MAQDYPIIIAGEKKTTADKFEVKSPYDGKVVATTYNASMEDFNYALNKGVEAFETLKQSGAAEKAAILGNVVLGLKDRAEDFAKMIALEAGKPITDARTEVKRAILTFEIAIEEAVRLGNPEHIAPRLLEGAPKKTGLIKRFPVGIVYAITPFNFPLNLVSHKVAPAMAAGNPLLIKPSPKTPITALMLADVMLEAGWPKGALTVACCSNDIAGRLAEDERVKKFTFTGSAAVGWELKKRANKKKVTLELGGNAGVIVDDGADIDFAVKRSVLGGFAFAGQVCISVQRIFVHKNIFAEFRDKLVKGVNALKAGDPLDESTQIGPMIERAAIERTLKLVEEAVKEGATLLCGGIAEGSILKPTIVTNVKPRMKVCTDELFAPVVTLAEFTDFKAAVDEVNNSHYGLQAGVFTTDESKISYAFETLDVGGVVVNDVPTFRADNLPYGGLKDSGFGREGVRYAIEEMTEIKVLVR
ncbi:MAG: aldehyde dehydrogenase family protein [Deltaproteobacteria bacterium]|nr:aldehyde dehydrogenase family protein [Deltaproteobacteria bacterium]